VDQKDLEVYDVIRALLDADTGCGCCTDDDSLSRAREDAERLIVCRGWEASK